MSLPCVQIFSPDTSILPGCPAVGAGLEGFLSDDEVFLHAYGPQFVIGRVEAPIIAVNEGECVTRQPPRTAAGVNADESPATSREVCCNHLKRAM